MEGLGTDFLSFKTTFSFFSALMAFLMTSVSTRPFLAGAEGAVAGQLCCLGHNSACTMCARWKRWQAARQLVYGRLCRRVRACGGAVAELTFAGSHRGGAAAAFETLKRVVDNAVDREKRYKCCSGRW